MDILILMQALEKAGFPDCDHIALLEALKKAGYDPMFHRLKYDAKRGYTW